MLKPQLDFYKNFGLDCSKQHISVDVFAFGGDYVDLATLGVMSQITSGEVYHYNVGGIAISMRAAAAIHELNVVGR